MQRGKEESKQRGRKEERKANARRQPARQARRTPTCMRNNEVVSDDFVRRTTHLEVGDVRQKTEAVRRLRRGAGCWRRRHRRHELVGHVERLPTPGHRPKQTVAIVSNAERMAMRTNNGHSCKLLPDLTVHHHGTVALICQLYPTHPATHTSTTTTTFEIGKQAPRQSTTSEVSLLSLIHI